VLLVLAGAVSPGASVAQPPAASSAPGVLDASAVPATSPRPADSVGEPASPGPHPSPDPGEPTASAQQLIAKALEEGRIDYPTSLVYRGYAFWGDDRLPDDLLGSGSVGEDPALYEEIIALGEDAPVDLREVLTSIVVRPADPRSIAVRQLPDAPPVAVAPRAAPPGAAPPAAAPAAPPQRAPWLRYSACPTTAGWKGVRVPSIGVNLKFWAVCDGTEDGDIAAAIGFARSVWWPMTQYMGTPIPDDGEGGDTAIDVYLVDRGEEVRGGVIGGNALAVTYHAEPILGRRSSAFVLMPRGGITSAEWKQAFIHEFFHVLQKRHNHAVSFTAGFGGWDEWWFTEASATWAEARFGPDRRSLTPHGWRFPSFQATSSATSLNVSNPTLHMYSAYVWPLFMQQEKGADVIRRAWDRLESVGPGDFDGADDALNGILPFRTSFREFAVRLFNEKLPGDPIAPRLQELDDQVPLDRPRIEDRSRLAPVRIKEMGHTITKRIDWLTASYIKLDPHPATRQVTLDFRKLQPAADLGVDLLVLLKGGGEAWTRRRVTPGERVRYCFNKPDQEVKEMYLILSNHQHRVGRSISGTFRVRPLAEPCGLYRISGSWTVKSGQGGVLTDTDFSATWDFSWDPGYDSGEPGSGTFHSVIATGTPPLPCNPGQFKTLDGRLEPSATSSGQRVLFVLSPDYRPWRQVRLTDPFLPDIFNTLLVSPQYGSRFIDVPIAGGRYRWRDGLLPIDVVCKGRRPTGLGTATVERIRDT
jgi:hypothetical protein